MKTSWIQCVISLVVIATFMGKAEIAVSDCDPSFTGGSITVTGGTLNGEALDPGNPEVQVEVSTTVEGTVNIRVENNGTPGNVFPVCATTSWGDHATSGWTIAQDQPPGTDDYAVPISVTTPSVPGTCYVFFAASWELTCGNVLSCTNWANGTGDVWDDGYDVADWNEEQAQSAIDVGWVCSKWLAGGELNEFNIPGGAVRIVVYTLDPVWPTSWGRIKHLYM
jgi:hypothetical protein